MYSGIHLLVSMSRFVCLFVCAPHHDDDDFGRVRSHDLLGKQASVARPSSTQRAREQRGSRHCCCRCAAAAVAAAVFLRTPSPLLGVPPPRRHPPKAIRGSPNRIT